MIPDEPNQGTSPPVDGTPDLSVLAESLERRFGSQTKDDYLLGKTVFRDALVEMHGLSMEESEQLIDEMEGLGYLRYLGDPQRQEMVPGSWHIDVRPPATSP